jgi:hypothetical protein
MAFFYLTATVNNPPQGIIWSYLVLPRCNWGIGIDNLKIILHVASWRCANVTNAFCGFVSCLYCNFCSYYYS